MSHGRTGEYVLTVSAMITAASTGDKPHSDNGMDNGKNPKDFERGSNPGEHKGTR